MAFTLFRRGAGVLLLALALCSCSGPPTPEPKIKIKLPPRDRVARVMPYVERSAARHKVPPELVLGVIRVESNFWPKARSRVGARGLMQLMPGTARSLARRLEWEDYDITDPAFNVEAGTAFLAYLLRAFDGDVRLALAAYNTGPARVKRWQRKGKPLAAYSKRYVAKVLAARDRFLARARGATPQPEPDEMDRDGLSSLIRDRSKLYGQRPDVELPAEQATSRPASGRQ